MIRAKQRVYVMIKTTKNVNLSMLSQDASETWVQLLSFHPYLCQNEFAVQLQKNVKILVSQFPIDITNFVLSHDTQ